ncbi:hypothetical protein HYU18_04830 [Candidatus Woesearchaeota archaeon]|nr:hypothetical protein [Candidatus Woesearchaeota archaeon]
MDEKDELEIKEENQSPVINIALDTVKIGKQALVFVATRQSAEKAAEEIAHSLKLNNDALNAAAEEALSALARPTKQCERLASCIKGGSAFHHSGLTSKQRQLIESSFRNGTIKIICCTPTLAAGVDLPAYRAVIRDLKRFSERGDYGYGGMGWIPVLEYLQMCGRAGRPSFDNEGQAIIFADSQSEEKEVSQHYIHGEPEEIYSKLAVEPVLRTHLLSLIATGMIGNRKEMMDFFSKTFWAHQYKNLDQLESTIERILGMLREWEFISGSREDSLFVTADKIGNESNTQPQQAVRHDRVFGPSLGNDIAPEVRGMNPMKNSIKATPLGQRIAELYLDPLTAHELIIGLSKAEKWQGEIEPFKLLQLISSTLEMRPLLRVKTKELEEIQSALLEQGGSLLVEEPSMYEEKYEDFLASIKTSLFFQEWIDENDEEYLLEKYGIRPGEIHAKVENADWLLYSSVELAKILRLQKLHRTLAKLRFRVQYGAREELLPLLQLKGIGRVRARKLFNNKVKTLGDAKAADVSTLAQILGSGKLALDVKEQLGQKIEAVREGKRKGQINLADYE